MRKIYIAANLPDAHIVLNLVERAGIRTCVTNANVQSVIGEVPVNLYPEVWVMDDEDYVRARKIVVDHEYTPRECGVGYCLDCGEENPRSFEICWHCGKALAT